MEDSADNSEPINAFGITQATDDAYTSTLLNDSDTSTVTTKITKSATYPTTITETKLTSSEQKAVNIIKSKIGTDNGKRIIEYDHIENFKSRKFYVIHAYYLGGNMTATYGWYDVDAQTWKAFENNLCAANDEDELVPLN